MAKKTIYACVILFILHLLSFMGCEKVIYTDLNCEVKSVYIDIVSSKNNWSNMRLNTKLFCKTSTKLSLFMKWKNSNLGLYRAYAVRDDIDKLYVTPLIKDIVIYFKNSGVSISGNLKTESGLTLEKYIKNINSGVKIDKNNKCIKHYSKDSYNVESYCYEQNFVFETKPDCNFGKKEQIILRVELDDGSVFTDTTQNVIFK